MADKHASRLPTVEPPRLLDPDEGSPLHIVLVNPEIPPNTGNVARLCAATGAWLHLVEPLGFELDNRKVKRAGLDYWPSVKLSVHRSFEELEARLVVESTWFFTKFASQPYSEAAYEHGATLVFGCETKGLPPSVREKYEDRCTLIPIRSDVRSLNLSNAVAVATYEALRQIPWF